jgi:hypothetical protein
VLNYYINIVFFPGNSSGLRTELYWIFLPSIIRFYHQTLLPFHKPHKQDHI